jgi:hypothetical protein
MDPKLMEILKKSAAIDKAAKKFDTTPTKGSLGGGRTSGRSSGGFLDEVAIHSGGHGMVMTEDFTPAERMDIRDERYNQAVDNSGLPPEVVEAMKSNPIPQPDAAGLTTNQFSEEDIRELRGIQEVEEPYYNDDDEMGFEEMFESKPARRPMREERVVTQQQTTSVSPDLIKRLVNEEIKRVLPKVLPKVVEHYIQQGLIKENMDILKKIKQTRKR